MMAWIIKYRVALLTTAGVLFAGAVAAINGWTSWGHIVHVGRMVGEPAAPLLPVSVDGMMLTGTVMASVDAIRKRRPRGWAIVSMWVGSIMTIAFNVGSAYERGILAMGIAVVPAVALLVTVETLFHPSKRWVQGYLDEKANAAAETAAETPEPTPTPVHPPLFVEPVVEPTGTTANKPRRRRKPSGLGSQARGNGTRGGGRGIIEAEVIEADIVESLDHGSARVEP